MQFASMTLIFGRGFRGPCEKWWRDRLLSATIFKRVLDNIRIKIRHLKGENKWEIAAEYYTHDNQPA